MTRVLAGISGVTAAVGEHLGYSDWASIGPERARQFAEATGGTIADGYFTLSLSNMFLPQIVDVQGFSAGVNYGTNKVRFVTPVLVGSRVRGGAELVDVTPVAGGIQTLMKVVIEVELADGSAQPACVIESISRWLV
jgi:acyl dehydratase